MPPRRIETRTYNGQKKMYQSELVPVTCKCPFYDCGALHTVMMSYQPPVMPRIACVSHRYVRNEDDAGDGYNRKEKARARA